MRRGIRQNPPAQLICLNPSVLFHAHKIFHQVRRSADEHALFHACPQDKMHQLAPTLLCQNGAWLKVRIQKRYIFRKLLHQFSLIRQHIEKNLILRRIQYTEQIEHRALCSPVSKRVNDKQNPAFLFPVSLITLFTLPLPLPLLLVHMHQIPFRTALCPFLCL